MLTAFIWKNSFKHLFTSSSCPGAQHVNRLRTSSCIFRKIRRLCSSWVVPLFPFGFFCFFILFNLDARWESLRVSVVINLYFIYKHTLYLFIFYLRFRSPWEIFVDGDCLIWTEFIFVIFNVILSKVNYFSKSLYFLFFGNVKYEWQQTS